MAPTAVGRGTVGTRAAKDALFEGLAEAARALSSGRRAETSSCPRTLGG